MSHVYNHEGDSAKSNAMHEIRMEGTQKMKTWQINENRRIIEHESGLVLQSADITGAWKSDPMNTAHLELLVAYTQNVPCDEEAEK